MFRYLTLLYLLCLPVLSFANEDNDGTGTIKGTIITSDNKPASDVTVQLGDKLKGTLTNENGEFTIRKVKPGNYFDATVFYDHQKFRLGLKLNNITDKRYRGINNDPQNPRQIIGSVSYKL
ncbi:carboxypeptidase-like regulatory domain-containing protein [Chitinophaga niabensis]|uniref:carboxypeptidase regulatory-like domain-containing protein n=1 Tax=Chitinophaga niabensis TaxID=536979 RepID=UPI0031B9F701